MKAGTRWEWGIAALLFVAALALRLPYLNLIPSYSDEGFEVLWGLDIALGKHLPLSGYPPHYGPLFAYLIALGFRVFGTSVELPRLLIAIFGAATVPATYLLGRVLRDRAVGLIAAGLTLTSPLLVILASHQGWSSGLTPFLTVATALTLYLGVTRRHWRFLAFSGLLAGLTLQAHATTGAALVGMALWFLLRRDLLTWLKQPAPYLALAGLILGYAPMIVANARGDAPLFQAAYDHAYVFAPTLDPGEYIRRVIILFKVFGYFVGEGFGAPNLMLRAQAIAIEMFTLAAVVWAVRARQWLIPFTLLGLFAVLPAVAIPEGYRYSMNLIPLAHTLNATFLVAIFRARAARFSNPSRWQPARWMAIALIVLFIASPLITIGNSYHDAFAQGQTNEGYFALARDARVQGACGTQLYVEDNPLNWVEAQQVAAFFILNNLNYVLTLNGCGHEFSEWPTIANKIPATGNAWLFTPRKDLDSFALKRISSRSVPHDSLLVPIYLYRIERNP